MLVQRALADSPRWIREVGSSSSRRRENLRALRIDGRIGCLAFGAKLSREVFIDGLAMADGDEANDMCLAVNGVDDSKTADAILP